jgi:nascent polypeptide-associated complex subunit alpha
MLQNTKDMLPMNPKQMKKMMKQMGIEMEEVDAEEVIIRTSTEEMIFRNPTVTKITARGVETFQIVGEYELIKKKPEISEDDVKLIMEQANVSEEEARRALEESGGDLAEALMKLQE